jgi:Zn-dependent metalloprotease
MTYGDGDGQLLMFNFIRCCSTRNRSCYLFKYNKLSLSKESGAMNKAFSDIWGACVEYYAAPVNQLG